MNGLLGQLPPGLRGYQAQRQFDMQEQNQQLGQATGLLNMRNAVMQQQQAQKDQELKGLLGQAYRDGDQNKMMQIMAQIDPIGVAKMSMPKAPKWQETKVRQPDGTMKLGYVDMNSPNPESTFRPLGTEPVKNEFVSGVAVNPYQPPSSPIPSATNPFNVVPDGKGGFTLAPNTPVQQFQLDKASRGATRVTNNVSMPGDDKYVNKRRELQATAFNDLEKGAMSAYNQFNTLDRFIKASEKGFAGGAAPLFAGATNLMSSFGINLAPDALKDTRIMEQAIGDILGNKMAELGARGLTDKDMEILRQNLPRVETDKASRVAVANVLKKASAATLREYENLRAEEAKNFPELAARSPTPAWFKDYQSNKGKFQTGGRRATDKMPAVGQVEDGYRFKGGDPKSPDSWEKI